MKRLQAAGALLLLLLVLSTVGPPASSQTPDPPRPDLAVTSIERIGPLPTWVEGEATDTRVRVTVQNHGTATSTEGYRIEYEWVKDGSVTWLNEDQQRSVSVHTPADAGEPSSDPRLAPGESRSHEAPWRLQPGQVGHGAVRVTVTPVGADARATNDALDEPMFVAVHRVSLDSSGNGSSIPLRADQTHFARLTVNNHGNVDETARITLTGTPQADAARLRLEVDPADVGSEGILVPAGGQATATLFVHYPFGGDEEPFSVQYGIEVDTGHGTILDGTTPAFVSLMEDMPPGSTATLTPLGHSTLKGDPGEAVEARFRLKNAGGSSDTYWVSAHVDDPGWTTSIDRPHVALEPGASQDFTVTVGFPETAPSGSRSSMQVSFQSERDAVREMPPSTRETLLQLHGPAVRITPGSDWPTDPYTGDPQEYELGLTNSGDSPAPEGVVTMEVTAPGTTKVTHSTPVAGIPAGAFRTVRFDLGAFPEDGGPVEVHATWMPVDGSSIATQDLFADLLLHRADIRIVPPAPLHGIAGETVSYRTAGNVFQVHNDGNAPETLRAALTTHQGDVDLALEAPEFTIAPGEMRSLPFDHTLPFPAGRATRAVADLTVSLVSRDMAWTAQAATDIVDPHPPVVFLRGDWPSVKTLRQAFIAEVEAVDGSAVESVVIASTSTTGDERSWTMARGAGDRWTASVTVEEEGENAFAVSATDVHGHKTDLRLSNVTGTTVPPPELALDGGRDGATVGPADTFHVTVRDDRPVTASLRIAWTDNETLVAQRTLDLDPRGQAILSLAALPPGNLTLSVLAANDVGANAEASIAITLRDSTGGRSTLDDHDARRSTPAPGLLALLALLVPAAVRAKFARSDAPRPETSYQRRESAILVMRGGSRRGRAGAVALTLLFVAASVLASVAPWSGPSGGDAAHPHTVGSDGADPSATGSAASDAERDVAADLDRLWSSLPEGLDPRSALGPAADLLFAPGPDGPRLKAAPGDAGELFGALLGADAGRIPIPDAPDGPEPLLAAIGSITDPEEPLDAGALRAQIASLGLVPEAERGLARLVLAYGEAKRLEDQALQGLDPQERLLLQGDADAWEAWVAQDPSRSGADREAATRELAGRIDMEALLRATDLLARTAEAVKDAIALPPDPSETMKAALAGSKAGPSGSPASQWDALRGIVDAAAVIGGADPSDPLDLPELPDQDLPAALGSLAATLGVPESTVPAVDLPPSLADAVAGIVTARWVGLSSGDATVHTRLLLDATERAEPTLRAWGAVLSLPRGAPDLEGTLEAVLSPQATPTSLIAARLGGDLPPAQDPASLVEFLMREGASPDEAAASAASLPPRVATALATLLAGLDVLDQARDQHLTDIQAAQARDRDVAALLQKPRWTAAEAERVQAWAEDAPRHAASMQALHAAQVQAMASVEAAAQTLATWDLVDVAADASVQDTDSKPVSWLKRAAAVILDIPIIGTASAQPTLDLCQPGPFSDCDADVLFYTNLGGTNLGGGILVTGSGQTTVGATGTGRFAYPATAAPRVILDLGGDDTYEVAAGAASDTQPTSVLIDAGGNDHYVSHHDLAHGAAQGSGTLGVLWDLGGNDHYEHVGDLSSTENYAQGVGVDGGIGVLVDGAGQDTYDAPRSLAHGSTPDPEPITIIVRNPINNQAILGIPSPIRSNFNAGLLLDQGAGDDTFRAGSGQGYAGSTQSLALLLNEDGTAHYDVALSSPRFQGGVGESAATALGALIDLGGRGTFYRSDALPEDATSVGGDGRRADDSLWAMTGGYQPFAGFPAIPASIGFGIDTTTDDSDGAVGIVMDLLADPEAFLENLPDHEEVLENPLEAVQGFFPLPGSLPTGLYLADPADGECDVESEAQEPYSLLHITGPTDDTIDVAAHVLIDLGGDDTYTSEVAGRGWFCIPSGEGNGTQGVAGGGYALDLDGNDAYDTPERSFTQGVVDVGNIHQPSFSLNVTNLTNPASFDAVTEPLTSVSLLLELDGDDVYHAKAESQGAVSGPGDFNDVGFSDFSARGAAWLVDVDGDDAYTSKEDSQGFVDGPSGVGALIDLAGDDAYTYGSQAKASMAGGGGLSGVALLLDREGQDHYVGESTLNDPLHPDNEDDLFSDQGVSEYHGESFFTTNVGNAPKATWVEIGLFIDEGTEHDAYMRKSSFDAYTDVSQAKNDRTRLGSPSINIITDDSPIDLALSLTSASLAGGSFIDGATRAYTITDEDGDGAPNLAETLGGTDIADAADHPGTFWQDPADADAIDGPGVWLDLRGDGGLAIGGRDDNAYLHGPYDFLVDLGGRDAYLLPGAGSGMFLLDAGEEDDLYAPATSDPSLGAPNGTGIAILLDAGGSNAFVSNGSATQGASLVPGGVGALVTWNATDRFEATDATAAQGAAVGGIGILASFGAGDDTYATNATDLAQGAASGDGTGLLVDGGGTNTFSAPDASRAQGSSDGGFGILWGGPGSDRYMAGDGAQGASLGSGVGVLLEAGGDDLYTAGNTSQAASAGVPYLGESKRGGAALLIDLGGHDRYGAVDHSQAYSEGGIALLLDVQGRDSYVLAGSDGIGYGCPSLDTVGAALFLDTAGSDRYELDGEELARDQTWSAPVECTPIITGIDGENLDLVLDALAPADPPTLEFLVDEQDLAEGDTTDGGSTLTLRARVPDPAPEQVRRVAFIIDGGNFGEGVRSGTDGDSLLYDHDAPLDLATFPDGEYKVYAHVVLETPGPHGPVGVPDRPGAVSEERTLEVDSVPRPQAQLTGREISSTSSAVWFNVTLDPDLGWPEVDGASVQANQTCVGGSTPGGHVLVQATLVGDDSVQHTLLDGYCPAGMLSLLVNKTATDQGWDEGTYNLTLEVTDNATHETFLADPAWTVAVDTTLPTSWIVNSPYASAADRNGTDVMIRWGSEDDGSGIDRVTLRQVNATGTVLQSRGPLPSSGAVGFPAEDGDVLRFVTVATDLAGNVEAESAPQEVTVDYGAPLISDVQVSAPFVQPGGSVTYNATATDDGSGLDQLRIRIRQGSSVWYEDDMTPAGDGNHSFTVVHDAAPPDLESPYSYEVTAFDLAGNVRSLVGQGVVDGRAPRVTHVGTTYAEHAGSNADPLPAGERGAVVRIHLHVQDAPADPPNASMERVTVDTAELNGSSAPSLHDCGPDASLQDRWVCAFELPGDVHDGVFDLPLVAVDAAGNTNASQTAQVVVSNAPLPIQDLEVLERSHDGFTVHWTTSLDSTSVIGYGRAPWPEGEDPPGSFQAPGGARRDHTVQVTGLSPSSTYHFHVVSESASGVRSVSDVREVRTLNAYAFQLVGFDEPVLGGTVPVRYDLTSATDANPVDLRFQVQDAQRVGSPLDVTGVFPQAPGEGTVALDTTRFADGDYLLIVVMDRFGDHAVHESRVFRVDNSEPLVLPVRPTVGTVTQEARPEVELILMEPGGDRPTTDGLGFRVDGDAVGFDVVTTEPVDLDALRVVIAPAEDLAHGRHTLNVSATDGAGNTGWVEWELRVDLLPPALSAPPQVVPLPGPDLARPGGRLQVSIGLQDDSPIAGAVLDLAPLGGPKAPLILVGDGRWEATVEVPTAASHGIHRLPVSARDALGNAGPVGDIEVVVDAAAPRVLNAAVEEVAFVNASLRLVTDEPTRARIGNGTWTAWGTTHEILADGLIPGEPQSITIHIEDRAGHAIEHAVAVTTLADEIPPGAPDGLTASSTRDGVVVLSWNAAWDNAGVAHYTVRRDAAPRAEAMETTATQTGLEDAAAPAGRRVTYHVTAVDVAGSPGPSASIEVDVHATAILRNASVSPEQASSDDPFLFQVEYVHPGGGPADGLRLHFGDAVHELEQVPDSGPCHTGCLYRAEVRLPPISQAGGRTASFVATYGDQQTTLDLADLPLVLATNHIQDHDDADGVGAPGPGFTALLAGLLALCAASRHLLERRRPRP